MSFRSKTFNYQHRNRILTPSYPLSNLFSTHQRRIKAVLVGSFEPALDLGVLEVGSGGDVEVRRMECRLRSQLEGAGWES